MTIVRFPTESFQPSEEFLKILTRIGLNVDRQHTDALYLEVFPNRPDLYSARTIQLTVDQYLTKTRPHLPLLRQAKLKIDSSLQENLVHGLMVAKRSSLSKSLINDLEQFRHLLVTNQGRMGSRFDLTITQLPIDVSITKILFSQDPVEAKGIVELYQDKDQLYLRQPIGITVPIAEENTETQVLILFQGFRHSDLLRVCAYFRLFFSNLTSDILVYPSSVCLSLEQTIEKEVSHEFFEKSLGISLSQNDIFELECTGTKLKQYENADGISYRCFFPIERQDILTEVDVLEELIIALGFERFGELGSFTPVAFSSPNHKAIKMQKLRETLLRCGMEEYMTMALSTGVDEQSVIIQNPLGDLRSIGTNSLLAGLKYLSGFGKRGYPKQLFEIKTIIRHDVVITQLCVLLTRADVNYTDVLSLASMLFPEDVKMLRRSDDNRFILGRVGEILHNRAKIGVLGEIHPALLERFGILSPVAALEIDLL